MDVLTASGPVYVRLYSSSVIENRFQSPLFQNPVLLKRVERHIKGFVLGRVCGNLTIHESFTYHVAVHGVDTIPGGAAAVVEFSVRFVLD